MAVASSPVGVTQVRGARDLGADELTVPILVGNLEYQVRVGETDQLVLCQGSRGGRLAHLNRIRVADDVDQCEVHCHGDCGCFMGDLSLRGPVLEVGQVSLNAVEPRFDSFVELLLLGDASVDLLVELPLLVVEMFRSGNDVVDSRGKRGKAFRQSDQFVGEFQPANRFVELRISPEQAQQVFRHEAGSPHDKPLRRNAVNGSSHRSDAARGVGNNTRFIPRENRRSANQSPFESPSTTTVLVLSRIAK